MGKLVVLAKFCVTAMVVSMLRTTCHQPPADTQLVSNDKYAMKPRRRGLEEACPQGLEEACPC